MANDPRTPKIQRASETREADERPTDTWMPQSSLPVPEPQDGYVFRWIRTSMLDKADVKNVSQQFREGWVPVKAKDHPEIDVMTDIDSRFQDGVEVGGLLLCKAPAEHMAKREQYHIDKANQQMTSVDRNYLREQDPRMPLHVDRKSRTSFGTE